MTRAYRIALLLLACCGLPPAAVLARQDLGPRIDALFETWDQAGSPGASVAVLHRGELIHSAGYGSAQLEYEIPIEPSTVFHVASVSKQFTAMAIVLLAQDGKLTLDDNIRRHVPEVPDFGAPLTLRNALHHTSGMRDQWELLVISGVYLDDLIRTSHALQLVSRQRELNFPTGTRHLYCNTGYTLAAETVARVSGSSFKEFCEERIFRPLEMESTHFHDDHRHIVPRRSYSYGRTEDGYQKLVLSYATVGPTSLFTTAPDAVRWLANFGSGTVGGAEGIEEMTKRGVLEDGKEISYALGVVHDTWRGWKTIGHGGADAGFRSQTLWFPEAELAIAVLSNLNDLNPGARAIEIAEIVLGESSPPARDADPEPEESEPAVAEAEIATDEPEDVENEPILSLEKELLESYAGEFATKDGFAMSLQRSHKNLYLRITGRPRKKLFARTPLRFSDKNGETRLELRADDQGQVTSFELVTKDRSYLLHRSSSDEPVQSDFSKYFGTYWSDELETLYEILEVEGEVVARHVRHGDIALSPRWPGEFFGDEWFFSQLEFELSENGDVTGFRLNGNRVLNLAFRRVEWTGE